jgi:hypothetical protein
MAEWFLSERAWTSGRRWVKRAVILAVFSLGATAVITGLIFTVEYHLSWKPLQRAYFKTYLYAASPTFLGNRSNYKFLTVRTADGAEYFATDSDVVQAGPGKFVPSRVARQRGAVRVEWREYWSVSDNEAYWKLRDSIYGGQSVWDLWRGLQAFGFLVFIGLLVGGIYWDRLDIAQKREGKTVKGPQLVTVQEFNRLVRGDGVGISVVLNGAGNTAGKPGGSQRAIRSVLKLRRRDEPRHFLVMGDTGAGKTTELEQKLDYVREQGHAAIVFDPAGEFTPKYYREGEDVILNPMDQRCPYWNPSNELRLPVDGTLIAQSLFPIDDTMPPGSEKRFFPESAAQIFAHLLSLRPTLEELIRWMGNEDEIDRRVFGSGLESKISRNAWPQRMGVLGTLSHVYPALCLLRRKEHTKAVWTAERWARERSGWVFITSQADTLPVLMPLISMWLDMLILRLMGADKKWASSRPVWMLIDELGSLQRLPRLPDLLTQSRKPNIRLVLGLHGRSQLDAVYGLKSEFMLSQPATKFFLKTSEPRAAEWISKSIGDHTVERLREGVTAGVHDWRSSMNYFMERRTEPRILPSEIQGLDPLKGFLKYNNYIVSCELPPPTLVARPAAEAFIPRTEPITLGPQAQKPRVPEFVGAAQLSLLRSDARAQDNGQEKTGAPAGADPAKQTTDQDLELLY